MSFSATSSVGSANLESCKRSRTPRVLDVGLSAEMWYALRSLSPRSGSEAVKVDIMSEGEMVSMPLRQITDYSTN